MLAPNEGVQIKLNRIERDSKQPYKKYTTLVEQEIFLVRVGNEEDKFDNSIN